MSEEHTYPIHKADETKTTNITLQLVDPFSFLVEVTSDTVDTDEDDISQSDGNNNVDTNNENIAGDLQETSQGTSSDSFPYSLRSRTNVPNLPLTMHKPVEYSRNK